MVRKDEFHRSIIWFPTGAHSGKGIKKDGQHCVSSTRGCRLRPAGQPLVTRSGIRWWWVWSFTAVQVFVTSWCRTVSWKRDANVCTSSKHVQYCLFPPSAPLPWGLPLDLQT